MEKIDVVLPEWARNILSSLGITELFPPQRKAIKLGVLEGKSLVVASPTGSGKSLIALLGVLSRLLRAKCKAVYMAPLKSIVYEREAEWRRILESIGFKLVVTTGDYDRVDPGLREADVVLTTYEKFDSILRHGVEWVRDICIVVVDEIHFIDDVDRGPILEVVLSRLINSIHSLQIIGLSATISNADEIAEWLDAELVTSDWRPVELREGACYKYEIFWGTGDRDKIDRITGSMVYDLALDTVSDGGQALVFVNSRRKAVDFATKLIETTYILSSVRGILEVDSSTCSEIISTLSARSEHRELNERLAKLAMRGIGFHHAGLASYQRTTIEDLFRRGCIKVLFATPTLAAGVNLPARRVIVDSIYRYAPGSGISVPIKVAEYRQLAGRAGRPGLDPYGEAIILVRSYSELERVLDRYIGGEPEPIVSKLVSEKALRSQVLAVVSSEIDSSFNSITSLFRRTLYALQRGDPLYIVKDTIELLKEMEFIIIENGYLKPTSIGKRVAELYIDPVTASRMLRGLEMLSKYDTTGLVAKALFLSLWNSDSVRARIPREFSLKLEYEAEEMLEKLGFEPYRDVDEADIGIAAEALYTSRALIEWIDEKPEDEILEKYSIDPGDFRAIIEAATWLTYSLYQLALITHNPVAPEIRHLHLMVRHGVKEELVELVKLPYIGRVRARQLYRAGYRRPQDLLSLTPEELAILARGIGVERAREVLEKIRTMYRFS